jgi:hypothetical protein
MSWIKLRTDLRNDPAVYKMAVLTGLDRFSIVGRLAEFWGWADQHAVDGRVDGASSQVVDDVVSHVGFCDALCVVGWLKVEGDGFAIPKHERHNGATAKERTLKSARQAKWRADQAPEKPSKHVDGAVDGKASTRGDKRRGDKKPPTPPAGGVVVPDWIPEKPWADFVAMRRAKGQKAPFTVAAAKGIIEKLDGFREAGHDIGACLSQSVISAWSDVYEPKARAPAQGSVLAGAI